MQLQKQAVMHARAGADVVAPSGEEPLCLFPSSPHIIQHNNHITSHSHAIIFHLFIHWFIRSTNLCKHQLILGMYTGIYICISFIDMMDGRVGAIRDALDVEG